MTREEILEQENKLSAFRYDANAHTTYDALGVSEQEIDEMAERIIETRSAVEKSSKKSEDVRLLHDLTKDELTVFCDMLLCQEDMFS